METNERFTEITKEMIHEQIMKVTKEASEFCFRGMRIPPYMHYSLVMYQVIGLKPGEFLLVLLQGNFMEAIGRADDINLHSIPAYAAYFYNNMPWISQGSKENVEEWMKINEKNRKIYFCIE